MWLSLIDYFNQSAKKKFNFLYSTVSGVFIEALFTLPSILLLIPLTFTKFPMFSEPPPRNHLPDNIKGFTNFKFLPRASRPRGVFIWMFHFQFVRQPMEPYSASRSRVTFRRRQKYHRIDRPTESWVLVYKSSDICRSYTEQQRRRQMTKTWRQHYNCTTSIVAPRS